MDSNSRGNCRTAPVIALPQGFREIPRLWTGFSYGALPEAKTRSKMVSVRIYPRVALYPRSPASYFLPKCEFQQCQCLRRCKRGVGTLTGVCKVISGGGVVGDFQVGLGFGPGFGQQPDPVPEVTLEQQSPQPVDAVADYADLPFRLLPTVAMPGRQRLGRSSQVAWGILRSWASSTLVP